MPKAPDLDLPIDELLSAILTKLEESTQENTRTSELLDSAIQRITALEKQLAKLETRRKTS